MVENDENAPCDLIFFDTFSHDLHEKLNLDLVQFPSPVFISEIRIVPLGARVQADFPGGGNRLGATNPSEFEIEFFVNDLSLNVASTFEPLGKFSYNQNECINLECKNDTSIRKIPTDGLVLKGCYTTITLAVYGKIITYGHMPRMPVQPHDAENNVVQVCSIDETNESENGETYNNENNHDIQDQNSSCDPTVSSTIADDLKEGEIHPNISPVDVYSRSPSKEHESKSKREWSNSSDEQEVRHKRSRVSGSFDPRDDRRKLRSPPLQSPRISRPVDSNGEEESNAEQFNNSCGLSSTFCPSSPSMDIQADGNGIDEDSTELEPILSDDDISDEVNGLDDYSEELFSEVFSSKNFNPIVDELRVYGEKSTSSDMTGIISTTIHNLSEAYNCTFGLDVEAVIINETWIYSCEQIIHNMNFLNTPRLIDELISNANKSVLETFHSCIITSLNPSLATRHQVPGCNLRHIKVGLRLMECLASSEMFLRWLIEEKHLNLFESLIQLLTLHLMPMPIKILVAKLVYCLTGTKEGIKQLNNFDGYKKIVNMLESIIDVRLMHTMKAIIKKLHANESLEAIKNLTTNLYKKCKDNSEVDYDTIKSLENLFIALKTTRKLDRIYSKKFLPIITQFEIDPAGEVINLVSSYEGNSFLETLMLLWDNKQILSAKLISLLIEYVSMMTKDGNEMSYIADNIQMANNFVKMLNEDPVYRNEGSLKLFRNEIGIEIAYKIETKYHLDWILKLESDNELSECLSSLYGLCIGPGRKYALEFIAMDENLSIFLKLIDNEKSMNLIQEHNAKQKSPVLNFSVDILDLVVRHCGNLDYLKRYGNALINLVKHHDIFEPSVAAILQEVAVFLKPLELKKVFTHDDIIPLIETVRRSKEYLTTFPGDLIMSLRILRHLISNGAEEDYKELKHAYFAVQFYHADGIMTLVSILEKLTSYYDQPSVHSYLLGANQGTLLTQIVYPTLQIIRQIQVEVITSRNVSFRDVTAIETLMKTYTLMQGFHSRSQSFMEAKNTQKEIIKTLLAYTQSLTPDGMTTTNIHKSLWTQMIGEVIKYTLNGPYRFIPGLSVLSELLPLPLPAPTESNTLTEHEMQRMVTERQLWSAHLHPQSHLITDMIQTFCTTSSPKLLQMAYRVCIQLSDLAPNMTLLVAKAVVDMILAESLDKNHEGNLNLARLLKFLGHLARHSSAKVSILSILSGKLADLMSLILSNVNDENTDHIAAQIQVFMLLHSLLDSEISLLVNSAHNSELIISSGLPTKELVVQFTVDIVEVFCKTSVENLTFASIRSMILLTNHDVTFNILKTVLTSRKENFAERINTIAEDSKSDKKQMTLLPDLLELFRALISVDPAEAFPTPTRTTVLTTSELACIISWNSEESSKIHFLEKFFTLLTDSTSDLTELTDVINIKSSLESLLELLKDKSQYNDEIQAKEINETVLSLKQAEGIVTQFSSRIIFCVADNLEELSMDYWFHNTCEDDDVLPAGLAQLDIDDIVKQCLPNETNVGSDCKRLLTLSSSPQSNRERNLSATCFRTRRVEVLDSVPGRMDKKVFTKFPPRGRGFSRVIASRGDIFRSRPPNTSRPPSLHVDDFLAMESGKPNYNKRDSIGSSRGRGRSISFASRGRGASSYNVRGHYSFYKPNFRGRSSRGIRGRGFVR